MRSTFKIKSLFLAVFASLALMAIFCVALSAFPYQQFIPCTDGWVQNLILTLFFAFVIQIILAPKIMPGRSKPFLIVHVVLILLVTWLGVYAISPFGYSTVLRGFVVITQQESVKVVPVDGMDTLSRSSAVTIYPLTFPTDVTCTWASANGGMFGDLHSCYTTYIPPLVNNDILKIGVQPGCGLPASTAQFRINILP